MNDTITFIRDLVAWLPYWAVLIAFPTSYLAAADWECQWAKWKGTAKRRNEVERLLLL